MQDKYIKSGHYLSNKKLLAEIAKCKANNNILSNELALALKEIADKASYRFCWNTRYIEDQQGDALLRLCENWMKFDESKYSNAFAYYTEICKMSYIRYSNKSNMYVYVDLLIVTGEANYDRSGASDS